MTGFQVVSLALAIVVGLVIPMGAVIVRGTIKWTRVETKLDNALVRLDALVREKDNTHSEILKQITEDRKATDQRLRWLEENVWRHIRQAGQTQRNRGG